MREKIYISTQEFHDFIKIYPVKLHCYLLVQKSDYLPITCTAPVSFAHFHAHSSVSYFFNANGFHPHSLLISLHRRWWRWNEEFTTSDTWHWADAMPTVPHMEMEKLTVNHNKSIQPTLFLLNLQNNTGRRKHQHKDEKEEEGMLQLLLFPLPLPLHSDSNHFRHHYPQVSYQIILKWLPRGVHCAYE